MKQIDFQGRVSWCHGSFLSLLFVYTSLALSISLVVGEIQLGM